MKLCNKCKIEKPYTEFSKLKRSKDGYQYKCKDCEKNNYNNTREHQLNTSKNWYSNNKQHHLNKTNQWRQSAILPYWIVYILPNEHYAGKTNNPYFRMANHQSIGRNTDGWYEVGRYENENDALLHEAKLHAAGYNGAHSQHISRQHKIK